LKQASINKEQLQSDGWGIAWYEGTRPVVEKGVGGAYEPAEQDAFIAAAGRAKGSMVLAHLRRASNPMGLPTDKLRGFENSQPFLYGKTVFVHNGAIHLPQETRKYLGKYAGLPKGVNDSEIFFYLLLKSVDDEKDVVRGYGTAMRQLLRVWEENGKPGKKAFSGLNVILSRSPKELWAFCFYEGDYGPSLSGIRKPYYEMCYKEDKRDLIVASEPMDGKPSEWHPLRAGHYLSAKLEEGVVRVSPGTIDLSD